MTDDGTAWFYEIHETASQGLRPSHKRGAKTAAQQIMSHPLFISREVLEGLIFAISIFYIIWTKPIAINLRTFSSVNYNKSNNYPSKWTAFWDLYTSSGAQRTTRFRLVHFGASHRIIYTTIKL
ncbi:unnamed protein product [Protopolystoma xenopodis]|uniref:Uncharacterized protein n=1 Tax=Protopolystoma xenopodis TaxID=117903 RepID=A0A448WQA3_9PLAT|nr:unnamed protein product [Protopolystoma xenopodis]